MVAAAEHALLEALDEIAFLYACEVRAVTVSESELERVIERVSTRGGGSIRLEKVDADGSYAAADVRDLATQPPVVRYVNLLVRDAYEARASDIHLEAGREGVAARFRIDGVLVPATDPPTDLQHAIISRIKLLAELDIAERRRPQDGRIRVRLEDRELDIRVATVPTTFGESVVLRLLDQGGRPVSLEQLGMTEDVLKRMDTLARRPHGLVLVTGPTGSGKTTTLYASLTRRDLEAEKVITVEDPVEYQVQGVTQVPVHRQAGVTFSSALRSILRQDPDVVMIGEMRDGETAEIAIQAALTGHLVLATLHTNDAVSAIPRLLDLGVPAYLVQATLEAVLAQRLVRRICVSCSTEYPASAEERQHFAELGSTEPMTLRRGAGCKECRGTGYRGRVGIFELLVVDDALRAAISEGAPPSVLRELAARTGMRSLASDGLAKAAGGLTTINEVLRVIHT